MADGATLQIPAAQSQETSWFDDVYNWVQQKRDEATSLARQEYDEHLAETLDPYIQAAEAEYEEIVQDVTPYVDAAASTYAIAQQTILSAIESETAQNVARSALRYAPVVIPLAQGNVLGAARNVVVGEVIEHGPKAIAQVSRVIEKTDVTELATKALNAGKKEVVEYLEEECPVCLESLKGAKSLYDGAKAYVAQAMGRETEQPEKTSVAEQLVSLVTVEDQSDPTDQSDWSDVTTRSTESKAPESSEADLVSNTPPQTLTAVSEETGGVNSSPESEETSREIVSAEPDEQDEQVVAVVAKGEESDEVAVVTEEDNLVGDSEILVATTVVEDPKTDAEEVEEAPSRVASDALVESEALTGLNPVVVSPSTASQDAQVGSAGLSAVAVASSATNGAYDSEKSRNPEGVNDLWSQGEQVRRSSIDVIRATKTAAEHAVEVLFGSGLILLASASRHFGDQATTYLQKLVAAQSSQQRRPEELNDARIVAGCAVFQQMKGGSVVDDGVVASLETEAEGRNLSTVSENSTTSGSLASGSQDPNGLLVAAVAGRDGDLSVDENIVDHSRHVSLRDIPRHPVDVLV